MFKIIISVLALIVVLIGGFILNSKMWMPVSMQNDTRIIRQKNIRQYELLLKLKEMEKSDGSQIRFSRKFK